MLFSPHFFKDGVEATVALLDAGSVALDPGVHQVEGLDIQAYLSGLRAWRAADQSGVLEDLEVLVDGLE
jgi:hypothetical protein